MRATAPTSPRRRRARRPCPVGVDRPVLGGEGVPAEPAEDEPPGDRRADHERGEIGRSGEAGLGFDTEPAAAVERPLGRPEKPPAAIAGCDPGAEGEDGGPPVEDGPRQFRSCGRRPGGPGVAEVVREPDGGFEGGAEAGAEAAVTGEPGGERGTAPHDAGHPGNDEDDSDEELLAERVDRPVRCRGGPAVAGGCGHRSAAMSTAAVLAWDTPRAWRTWTRGSSG